MGDFKSSLSKIVKFNWQAGVVLILLFGIPRFIFVLNASQTGNYSLTSIIFLFMWVAPFVVLSQTGRKAIGICKPTNFPWLIYSFLLGIVVCTIVYFLGKWFYQMSISNWFVYISNSYDIPVGELEPSDKRIHFTIFAVIGMTLSPIGEELLYRGLIHQSFVPKFGNYYASIADSTAFSLTHLAHFGIVYSAGVWEFLPIPALLWMLLMFFTSRVFYHCKSRSGSIYGAILSHAGFNLAMTYFIFYHIL